MDAALKAKLDQARERMSRQQAGINTNRVLDDPAMREWARGKQRPSAESEFRAASITEAKAVKAVIGR